MRQSMKECMLMSASWSFAQWRLDIVGPFFIAIRQLKFLIFRIDYFTKWVEVEPLATITEKNVWNFVWKVPFTASESPGSSSLTIEYNLTMTRSEIFANNWGLRTTTPSLLTPRPMEKLKSQTDPCSRWLRLGLRGQMVYGQMNYPVGV